MSRAFDLAVHASVHQDRLVVLEPPKLETATMLRAQSDGRLIMV